MGELDKKEEKRTIEEAYRLRCCPITPNTPSHLEKNFSHTHSTADEGAIDSTYNPHTSKELRRWLRRSG
jgi:hypothetical protein